ncbi:MAG TPA: hypothetical protein VJT67_04660 [Longimicrobiaceae bacterium]|nr:hypothetical protein [Longimicrobiaceae bacterium]
MTIPSRIVARLAAAVLLALPTALVAQDAAEAGFVLSVSGDSWFASSHPSERLKVGRVLMDGESVWTRAPRQRDQSLNIVVYNSDPILLQCWNPPRACARPLRIVGHPAETRWGALWAAVKELLGQGPEQYGTPRVRGSVPLREAVLTTREGMVDLAPALADLRAGEKQLQAASIDARLARGQWQPLQVTWTPGTPALVPASAVPSGLFALRVGRDSATEAWMLVDASANSPDAAAQLDALYAQLQAWSGKAAPDNADMFLRAALHHLATRGGASDAP